MSRKGFNFVQNLRKSLTISLPGDIALLSGVPVVVGLRRKMLADLGSR